MTAQPALMHTDATLSFEPTLSAALARLAAVRPGEYARSRNHLDGAVTRLSPYITHGFLSLPEVLLGLQQRFRLDAKSKLVYELAWREFFHHVWQHEGDGIFSSLHAGVLPEAAYANALPADIRRGATGVPVIDQAVRCLYASGYLHNHARMWLASYVVHLRKVHWRAGADWLYGHLLDGDLASNHLSWQWVAATGSHKPYLFNADNVARFAPAPWHSPGTPVDATYEALDTIARSECSVVVVGGDGVDEPPLLHAPPPELQLDTGPLPSDAWLVHPWALRLGPSGLAGRQAVGVFAAEFHAAWPWSAARWRFVAARMAEMGVRRVWLQGQPPAHASAVNDPHLAVLWSLGESTPVPRLFASPATRCASFSQYFARVSPSLQF
jgi:deoxyribodipyrimidine photo-lyase